MIIMLIDIVFVTMEVKILVWNSEYLEDRRPTCST